MSEINIFPLKLFAWVVILFGAVLCLAGFTLTLAPVDLLYKVFHPGEGHAVWGDHLRFSTGLMGAVTLGWGLTLLALAKHTAIMNAASVKALWGSVTTGMIIWLVIDSVISIANGFWVNALSNAVIAAIYFWAIGKSGVRKV
ncbi:hypothetical protein [Litorimonas sp. WD9-15]|uniref:hypothetical protein n=1 Tax=Litorimonas sp. WD9-15 TaxID=3418716 RepID=UPI003D06123D